MSPCRNCGSGRSGCTCSFISSSNAIFSGNGRSYSAVNFRPSNVPLPRPYGEITRRNNDQTIGSSTTEAVGFDNEFIVFAGGMSDVQAQPTRLTAPADGYYIAGGFINSNNVSARLFVRKNGVTNLEGQTGVTVGGISTTTLIDMVVGDYLELMVTTAGLGIMINRLDFTFSFISTDSHPVFWAQWVRPL